MRTLAFLVALGLLQAAAYAQVDRREQALQKALGYLTSHQNAEFPGPIFAGYAYLADTTGGLGSELSKSVDYAIRASKRGGFNGNWYWTISGAFLSFVYLKYPDSKIGSALQELVAKAEKTQEPSGGWQHSFGARPYKKLAGKDIPDICMLTSMAVCMMLNMKAAGLPVPEACLKRALENLRKNARGAGFAYGTGNPTGDAGCGRGSWTFCGLFNAKMTGHPLFSKLQEGVTKSVGSLDRGHGLPTLTWLSSTLAHLLLRRTGDICSKWLDKLLERQQADGSLALPSREADRQGRKGPYKNTSSSGYRVSSTAVFAMLLMGELGKGDLKPKRKPEPRAKKIARGGAGGSPFGRRETPPESSRQKGDLKPKRKPEPRAKKIARGGAGGSPFGRRETPPESSRQQATPGSGRSVGSPFRRRE